MTIRAIDGIGGAIFFMVNNNNKLDIIYYNLWKENTYYIEENPHDLVDSINQLNESKFVDLKSQHYRNINYIMNNYELGHFYNYDVLKYTLNIERNINKYL